MPNLRDLIKSVAGERWLFSTNRTEGLSQSLSCLFYGKELVICHILSGHKHSQLPGLRVITLITLKYCAVTFHTTPQLTSVHTVALARHSAEASLLLLHLFLEILYQSVSITVTLLDIQLTENKQKKKKKQNSWTVKQPNYRNLQFYFVARESGFNWMCQIDFDMSVSFHVWQGVVRIGPAKNKDAVHYLV